MSFMPSQIELVRPDIDSFSLDNYHDKFTFDITQKSSIPNDVSIKGIIYFFFLFFLIEWIDFLVNSLLSFPIDLQVYRRPKTSNDYKWWVRLWKIICTSLSQCLVNSKLKIIKIFILIHSDQWKTTALMDLIF